MSAARSRSDRAPGPIAFFLPSVRGGGAQRVIINLIQGMVERGLRVDLVLTVAGGSFLDQIPPRVRLIDLAAGRLIRSLAPLSKYLRQEQPRMLVSSMTHANLIALWAARLARRDTPVMVTEHDTMSRATRGRGWVSQSLLPRLLRTFYPWAASVVAVSRGAADDLARTTGLPRDKVQVIYNPVITPEILERARQAPDHPWFGSGQPPVILGVGRLTPQKDFRTLIQAFAQVRRNQPARLIILGEGPEEAALQALVRELGLEQDVALPGFRDNAVAYMAASKIFALSSAWEGLPTVLIEALAAGASVVSTDCPSGPREILDEGRLGALVPVGDAGALAKALGEALERPRGQLPSGALSPFTLDYAVNHYLQLIEASE